MKCNNKQKTIKVTEGNAFVLVLPLKRRTYASNVPIDEDINCAELEDVELTIGGVPYDTELGTDGVRVSVPELTAGTYDIVLTATYHEADIRAAYFEGLAIVPWNYMSDAEQYLPGSPIIADAAIIIGGPLTDEELAELKTQYRQKIAEATQAKADYDAAKDELEEKAEQLDDVAQETTSREILNAVGHIDFSTLAKQGTNPSATNTAIYEKLGDPVMMTDAEYTPALADLDTMLEEMGEDEDNE